MSSTALMMENPVFIVGDRIKVKTILGWEPVSFIVKLELGSFVP